MNEAEFAYKLTGHLAVASREVSPKVAERLRRARNDALAARPGARLGPEVALRLRLGLGRGLRTMATVVLVLALFGAGQVWRESVRMSVDQDIDAALLIDDLPIDAYLDPEFKAWVLRELQS